MRKMFGFFTRNYEAKKWNLLNCNVRDATGAPPSLQIDSSLPFEDQMIKMQQELHRQVMAERNGQPYVKHTRNFYRSSYACPYCGERLYKSVFPVGGEYSINTVNSTVRLKRVFSCDHCKVFLAPMPGVKLSAGRVYINKLDATSYSNLMVDMDNNATTEGRPDL